MFLFFSKKNFFKLKKNFFSAFDLFYIENPALILALTFLLGTLMGFLKNPLITALTLIFSIFIKPHLKFFFLILMAYLYTYLYYPAFPKNLPKNCKGTFKISSIIPYKSYTSGFICKGRFKKLKFEKDEKTYKNIPGIIYYKKSKRPNTNFTCKVKGTARLKSKYHVIISTKELIKHKKSFNLLESRIKTKNALKKKIKKHIKNKDVSNFFIGITTGNLTDRFLRFSFKKVGLQHLLVISGFHFGILVMLFSITLKKIIPPKYLAFLLILITNLYFLFLGPTPSIQRAYITVQIALLALIFNRKNFALNTLGISLLITLISNPLNLFNIGFQLTFLSVFSILLIYPQINLLVSKVLIKRSLKDLSELDIFSKIGGFLSNLIRETFSLTLSVNLAIIPILLFYFHKFPMLSLIYNLFFSPLFCLSILLFILAIPFHFATNSFFIDNINTKYTKFLLDLISNPPENLEFFIRTKSISISFIIVYLIIYFSLAIFIKYHLKLHPPKALDFF
jgi:competence protein ComEC